MFLFPDRNWNTHGPDAIPVFTRSSVFIQLNRKPVRIPEECKPLAREFIHANRLECDPSGAQHADGLIKIGNSECKVTQPARLRLSSPLRWCGKAEQLELRSIGQREVELVRIAISTVSLGDDTQPQGLRVERAGTGVFRYDDRDMVNPQKWCDHLRR